MCISEESRVVPTYSNLVMIRWRENWWIHFNPWSYLWLISIRESWFSHHHPSSWSTAFLSVLMWFLHTCTFYLTIQYRTNFAGMPLLREMYKAAKRLYDADYYGYTNSDILISASLFPILDAIRRDYKYHRLTDGVHLFILFYLIVFYF